jgi:hypothetical protein
VQRPFDVHFLIFSFPSGLLFPNLILMNLEDRFRAVRQQIRVRQPLQKRIDLVRERIASRRRQGTAEPRSIQIHLPASESAK